MSRTRRWGLALGLLFGRVEIGWFAILASCVVLIAGCGADRAPTFETPSGAVSETTSLPPTGFSSAAASANAATQTREALEPFVRFASELDSALRRNDLQFLLDRIETGTVVCREEDVPGRIGGPACTTVGETFASFGAGNWRSHGGVVPVKNVVDQFTRLTASVRTDLTDGYGPGVLRVYALNIDDRRRDAIVTAIIKPPPDFGGRDSIRVAIGMSWGLVEGEWRLLSIMNNYVFGPEFLDPSSEVVAGLYPKWEPYGLR